VGISFSSFLSSVGAGAPVVCFGPRSVPAPVLAVARSVGASVARSGRPVFSGGARGCDRSFAAGASGVGGAVQVFRPAPGSGVRGLFARSRLALVTARAGGGAAVVFVPLPAFGAVCGGRVCRGGSAWSARCALSLGLPLFLVGFSVVGGRVQWRSAFFPGRSGGGVPPPTVLLRKQPPYIRTHVETPEWVLDERRRKELRLHDKQCSGENTPSVIRAIGTIAAVASLAVIGLFSTGVIENPDLPTGSAREGISYNSSSQWNQYWLDYDKGGD